MSNITARSTMEEYPDLPQTFKELDINLNSIPRYTISDFFDERQAKVYTKKQNIESKFEYNAKQNESEDAAPNNTIKGLYIFFDDDKPIYVGISRNIIRRLKQHFYGKLHNHCTVAYQIARDKFVKRSNSFNPTREKFDLDTYREKIQSEMRKNWQISIIPETNDYLLALKEICYAIKYKTKYNSFKTH